MSAKFSTPLSLFSLLSIVLQTSACVAPRKNPTPSPDDPSKAPSSSILAPVAKQPVEAPHSRTRAEEGTESPAIEKPSGDLETLAIVGTNDLHGTLRPLDLRTREPMGLPSQAYEAAGLPALAANLKILRSEFREQMLWLDAGDQFQGSLESNQLQGAPLIQFFNENGLAAASLGNHEFDYGPEASPEDVLATAPSSPLKPDLLGALKARMREARYPYLGANILNRKTGLPTDEFPNLKPSHLFRAGSLKVGVIGISTEETPVSTSYGSAIAHLLFSDPQWIVRTEAEKLRAQGAQIVVLVAHVGMFCQIGRASSAHSIRKPHDPLGVCNETDELMRLLSKIPEGTVDAVISGHTHQITHHWVHSTPVIQGGAMGRYINVIYLTYDPKQKRVLHERDRIEGPIPICPKVFSNQKDCNGDRLPPEKGRGELVYAKLHGKTVVPDAETQEWLNPITEKTQALRQRVVGQAARRVEINRNGESELGNFIADSIREYAKAQVSIINSGGIRAPWDAGPITYESLFRTLPFENTLATLDLKGSELSLLMRIVLSGHRGYFSFSGIKARVLDLTSLAPHSSDLNGNGKIESWEVDRIRELSLENGQPIDPEARYSLATLDFLAHGGDELGWFMNQISSNRVKILTGILVRDVIEKALKAKSPLNRLEAPLIDPQSPRLSLLKVKDPVEKARPRKAKKRKRSKKAAA